MTRSRHLPSGAGCPAALLGLGGLATFALLLEVLPRAGVLPADYFPPASRIALALLDEFGQPAFREALGDTLLTWVTSLAIAVGAGIAVGVAIGSTPLVRDLTASTIEFLRPIPSVALIPGLIVLLGTGMESTLVIAVYASFWQVLVQVLYGVADVDPVARETAHSYRLKARHRIRYVVWPTTLPYVMTGIRLAAAVALILTITGELVIGTPGLGKKIDVAYSSGDVPSMYALIAVTGLIGVLANVVTRRAERWALVWHPSVRGESPA
ncbi:nitrate ABC transporter permease [Rhizocola hellebori]|uniref:Nitrate ABC transporter permease n=1 Tax=Rhizocola hellebori TaxID=1392758 RepID=A0A8J3VGA1_9ACTN|nr:ABC transporter permease [Rhizocola hellebori]GIH04917.1 nitrate ABC transporter permease [Rhizocola hellebori]